MILPANLTRHHLVPKARGGRDVELICKTCHRQIHALFGNQRLASGPGTLKSLKANPVMRKYLKWAAKQNPDRYYRGKARKGRD